MFGFLARLFAPTQRRFSCIPGTDTDCVVSGSASTTAVDDQFRPDPHALNGHERPTAPASGPEALSHEARNA